MGDQVLLDEIDDLKEVVDNLKQDINDLKDESDKKIEDLTAAAEKIKEKTENEWKMRMKAADREARERTDLIMLELEMMRQAFSGDTGGWKLVETSTKDYYENEDTGEIRDDEPEVMFVARSMQACEEAKELIKETEELREEVTQLKKKNKELNLSLTKKTNEANALSRQDKAWKETAKVVHKSMLNVKAQLDQQVDHIVDGLNMIDKTGRRCHFFVPGIAKAQTKYLDMKNRFKAQEEKLVQANSSIRSLSKELEECRYRVDRLSNGIDAEVERLVLPMRQKMGDAMTMVMKEKAARAQERRELADQWPSEHLMPTILMQYRCLDDAERARRVQKYHEANANRALSLEIRANVIEATMWEMEYDDYGRPFYKHKKTGEKSEEEPEIMSYKPPPGRDAEGNITFEEEKLKPWIMKADNKGIVYFEHKKTGETTYDDPYAYPRIPSGKTKDILAAEAAQLVLTYIKAKIAKHIKQKKKEKRELRRQKRELAERLAAEEAARLEEEANNPANDGENGPADAATDKKEGENDEQDDEKKAKSPIEEEESDNDEDLGEEEEEEETEGEKKKEEEEDVDPPIEDEDLSSYLYDIETVEMIADRTFVADKNPPSPEELTKERLSFNEGKQHREFDKGDWSGPSLLDTDPTGMEIDELRVIIETLAKTEEKLDVRLQRTRSNINDFSYILLEQLRKADEEKIRIEREKREAEYREKMKLQRRKQKKEARIRQRIEQQKIEAMIKAQNEEADRRAAAAAAADQKETIDGGIDLSEGAAEGTEVKADDGVGEEKKDGETAPADGVEIKTEGKEEDGGTDFKDSKDSKDPKEDGVGDEKKDGEAATDDKGENASKTDDDKNLKEGDRDGDMSIGEGALDQDSVDASLHTEDMSDDEDFEQLDNQSEHTMETLTEINDPDVFIYGDVSIVEPQERYEDEILKISKNLINFAVFCGYTNMHVDSAPEDVTLEFSLMPESIEDQQQDDQWLTSSFFLGLSDHRVDAIREMVTVGYDPDLGLLNSSPLATSRLINTGEYLALGEIVNKDKPKTSFVGAVHKNLMLEHATWKSRQLMAEVIRYNCQKVAVREAYYTRFRDYKYDHNDSGDRKFSKLSLIDESVPRAALAASEKPVQLVINKIIADGLSTAVWADQQSQCVEISLGGWSFRTQSQMATGRTLVWEDMDVMALVSIARVQLDDLIIRFFEEHEVRSNVLVATGRLPCYASLLGSNTGKDVDLTFKMKDRRGGNAGSITVNLRADYERENDANEEQGDADNLINENINLVESEVDKAIPIPILPFPETAVQADGDTMKLTEGGGVIQLKSARSDTSNLTENTAMIETGKIETINENEIAARLANGRQDSKHGEIDPRFDHLEESQGGRKPALEVQDPLAQEYLAGLAANNDGNMSVGGGSIQEDGSVHTALTSKGASQANQSLHSKQSMMSKGSQATKDSLHGHYPTLIEEKESFESLVAALRGDGINLVKMATGDITFGDVKRTGHRIGPGIVSRVPNFEKTTQFLKRKSVIHQGEREFYSKEAEEMSAKLEPFLKGMLESARATWEEAEKNHRRVLDSAQDTRRKVKNIGDQLNRLREPARKPQEPVLPDLPPVPYVPPINETGAVDEKGKKKKQIPNKDLRTYLEECESGARDSVDWDFGKYWPSQAQAIKINKAINDRAEVLDLARAEAVEGRNKLMNRYLDELKNWDVEEKKRVEQLNKTKKSSRKANLKLDCFMDRADRRGRVLEVAERNYKALNNLMTIHTNSNRKVQSLQTKCYLESERQRSTITKLRKRMLKALDARRRALDLPKGALNNVDFEEMRSKAEVALRTLRVEVVECKQLLVQEGVRMRTLRAEEVAILRHDYLRTSVSYECVKQMEGLDKILIKNQYEVLHLMEAMEKLVLIEADKDDRGLRDTVDDAGERYIPGKRFKSPEITECQTLIDLVMAKIDLIEGLAFSGSKSLACLVEAIDAKWGVDFSPVRDSWVENSDYERANRMVHDVVTWVTQQRQKIIEGQKLVEKETSELKLQVQAADAQAELMLQNQERDTKYVTESALDIVNVMQNHIADIRDTAAQDKFELNRQVTDVTRECQVLREQIMRAKQDNDEKSKLLWSVISTLQTAAQSLASRMDIIIEERDKIVVASRLESDKMKHQLRQERKHSANLTFIIHSQRGSIKYLHDVVEMYTQRALHDANARKAERSIFRKEIWEQIFSFSRLSTDVNELFLFFTSRLANLAGARKSLNDDLAKNGAAIVLSALCKSPRPMIRKFAARALGNIGWDGFVETRILLWDCVSYWKSYKNALIQNERSAYNKGFESFKEHGKFEALLNIEGQVEEFVPSGNMSLRTIIKQRRQWALRAARRQEGPNTNNLRLINMREGVIPALLSLAVNDGAGDWEIAKNAALAISVASYEMSNHEDMTNSQECIKVLLRMCESRDAEIQTHAAVTIANLCHKDEHAQLIFGNSNVIPVLVNMCSSLVVDVLEATTCALANLTCYCDPNCNKVMEANGVEVMVNLVAHAYSENLLDLDQNDEVQANAMEMLANISRVNSAFTAKYFNSKVINAIVLMCAAVNVQVKRHAPLVLGNMGQSQECRELIGELGGIEALFLVLEDEDATIKANTLWALCNLMWHPGNQERAGRFMDEIYSSMWSEFAPIKINASILLANALYYNNSNRVRFLEIDGGMDALMNLITARQDNTFVESSLRAILSLSYLDNVALWLGEVGDAISIFLELMKPPYLSRECMRYSLEIMSNLCVHHSNRAKILDLNGVGTIISLSTDPDIHIQDLQAQVIEYLGDVTPIEVLTKAKMDIGLERMVVLATNNDPQVRSVAAESIGEEIWQKPELQQRALEVGAFEVLLNILNNDDEGVNSLLPAIWSIRNVLHNNRQAQEQCAHRDALAVFTKVVQRCAFGQYGDHTEKIIEAVLAAYVAAISNHERNSRRLLVVGLEAIMDISDGKIAAVTGSDKLVTQTLQGEGTIALAKSIMLMLGPYNYVVCRNCSKKQELVGQSCMHCGYRIRVDASDNADRQKFYHSHNVRKALTSSSKDSSEKEKILIGSQSTSNLKKIRPGPKNLSDNNLNNAVPLPMMIADGDQDRDDKLGHVEKKE